MEALVTAFVAAFLAEWGDKTQLIVAMLAATTRKPGQVLAGLFLAALASNVIAAIAGVFIAASHHHPRHDHDGRARPSVRRPLRPDPTQARPRPPPRACRSLTAFILCLAAEFGDRTQFLTFALAGRFDSAPLAAAGATAGIVAACLPAAVLGEKLQEAVPMRAIRYVVAALFVIAGFIAAVKALQLA